MFPDITIDVEAGSVHIVPVPLSAQDQVLLQSDGYLCGWSLREAAGEVPSDFEGSVTTPGAGATIATSAALAAGTYTVKWTVTLGGTPAAADANNFQLFNGATLVATSVNLGAIGDYPQADVQVTVVSGAVLTVKALGAGTAGAIYSAQGSVNIDIVPDAIIEIQDVGNPIAEISLTTGAVNSQWFGPQGLKIRGQIKLHMVSGTVVGAVYARFRD
jgi:hypothetical protein